MKEYKYEATIKPSHAGTGGAYIEFPFDVEKEFSAKGRIKVLCYFDGIVYRGSLVKIGPQNHIIGISKDIRTKLNKNIGDRIQVTLSKDEEEKVISIHPLLQSKLNENKLLQEKYNSLPYTRKKEIAAQLTTAKKAETIKSRLEKIIAELLE